MLKSFALPAFALAAVQLAAPCQAQTAEPATASSSKETDGNHIAVGLGALFDHAPFKGETTHIYPIPLLSIKQGAFYLEATELGTTVDTGNSEVQIGADFFVAARNRSGRDRTKITADSGGRIWISTKFGRLSGEVRHDITGTFNGTEAIVRYAVPIRTGNFSITPAVQVNWLDRRTANYLYGITADQRARMIAKNRSVILPVAPIATQATNVGGDLTLGYAIDAHWSLFAVGSGSYLGKSIRQSPAMGEECQASIITGVSYRF